jgi:nucleoid DNA-binding protein
MTWTSKAGKSGLIHLLMDKTGLSKRKSERSVDAMFAAWRHALASGQKVEIPGGSIQVKRTAKHSHRRLATLQDIHSHRPTLRLVEMPARVIHFISDESLDLECPHSETIQYPWIGCVLKVRRADPNGPLIPEDDLGWHLRYLFQQALGWVPSPSTIDDVFLPAASGSIGTLIARLQELSKRGQPMHNERLMASAVSTVYDIQ